MKVCSNVGWVLKLASNHAIGLPGLFLRFIDHKLVGFSKKTIQITAHKTFGFFDCSFMKICQFFQGFEMVTRTNGSSILFFFFFLNPEPAIL
jgi:hypothetical protein